PPLYCCPSLADALPILELRVLRTTSSGGKHLPAWPHRTQETMQASRLFQAEPASWPPLPPTFLPRYSGSIAWSSPQKPDGPPGRDRKSTRLNSSHSPIS